MTGEADLAGTHARDEPARLQRGDPRVDLGWGLLILVTCFAVFRMAPIQQAYDSRYSLLVADNLLRHGTLALDDYHLSPDYRLEAAGGHSYYCFPVGTSLLSLPYVALMRAAGVTAVRPDGSYDADGELALDASAAAMVTAAFACVTYFSARLLLSIPWSLLLTVVAAFGTQAFSTASRSMWSDTWGILLTSISLFWLLRASVRRQRPPLFALGTIEAWAYFVRPTNSLLLCATAAYLAWSHRRWLFGFALPVAIWLALFVGYSERLFHTLLPSYYAASRLAFAAPAAGLLGTLFSPGRGLLVYVPVVLAAACALPFCWSRLRDRPLAAAAIAAVAGHLAVVAGFERWWGGYCYGARLTTGLVPWFVLLGVLEVDAILRATPERRRRPRFVRTGLRCAFFALCLASIAINAIGAFSWSTHMWNGTPQDVDHNPWRLWDWRRPQFLAPFVDPRLFFPPLPAEGLPLGTPESERYLGAGWDQGDGVSRWTLGRRSSVLGFSRPTLRPELRGGDGVLELDLYPYLPPNVTAQRLDVQLNGHTLARLTVESAALTRYDVRVPAALLRERNVLRLNHPDAVSPAELRLSRDPRQLGFAVRRLEWRPPADESDAGADRVHAPR